jgi:hypothetical protein
MTKRTVRSKTTRTKTLPHRATKKPSTKGTFGAMLMASQEPKMAAAKPYKGKPLTFRDMATTPSQDSRKPAARSTT